MSELDREQTDRANDRGSGRAAWLGALAIAVAFGAGIGVGVLVADAPPAGSSTGTPSADLFDDLGLTAEQQAVVDSVLSATRTATAASLEDARRELTTQAVEALRAIEAVLEPGQIERLKARIEARKAEAGTPAGASEALADTTGTPGQKPGR